MDTYTSSGFDAFFSKSIAGNSAPTLQSLSNNSPLMNLNFDQYQTSGSLGDKIQVGGVTIDGTNRRIIIQDESGQEVGWIGNLNA